MSRLRSSLVLVPVARCPDPNGPSSPCVAPHPDHVFAWRPFPVPTDPDPRAQTYNMVSLNPDMESAWAGRPGDDDRWWWRRGTADLNLLNNNRAGPVRYNNTAGHEGDHKKASAAEEIFYVVHNLLLPSTQERIQQPPATSACRADHIRPSSI